MIFSPLAPGGFLEAFSSGGFSFGLLCGILVGMAKSTTRTTSTRKRTTTAKPRVSSKSKSTVTKTKSKTSKQVVLKGDGKKTYANSKYKVEYNQRTYDLALIGYTNKEIAKAFEVSEPAFYGWLHKYPELKKALDKARESADAKVANALFRRAIGFTHKDTHFASYQGEIYSQEYDKYLPPDVTAGMWWLKNRRPQNWSDKKVIEHEGLLHVREVDMELTSEEEEMFRESLHSLFGVDDVSSNEE